jgi:hypothetical protein
VWIDLLRDLEPCDQVNYREGFDLAADETHFHSKGIIRFAIWALPIWLEHERDSVVRDCDFGFMIDWALGLARAALQAWVAKSRPNLCLAGQVRFPHMMTIDPLGPGGEGRIFGKKAKTHLELRGIICVVKGSNDRHGIRTRRGSRRDGFQ